MDVIKKLFDEKWTKYIFMSILIILFLLKPTFTGSLENDSLLIYLIVFFISVAIHLLSIKDQNWFRLDILFLLGFGIVHFQWAMMFSLSDITPLYILLGRVGTQYVNYATWLSVVGINAWFLGYTLRKTKRKNVVIYRVKYKKLLWVSKGIFLLFLLLAGSNFLSGGVYKGQGGSSVGAGVSVYFQLLFSISILVLTTVVLMNSKHQSNIKVFTWIKKLDKNYLLLVGVYILLFLSIGDRGAGIQVVLTFLVVFGAIVKPISFKQFSAIIIIGAIVLTLVGLGRSSDSGENILVAGANKAEFSSGYDVTMELANSTRTLYIALENVPSRDDYFYGKLWIGTVLSIIPLSQNIYLDLSEDKMYEMGSAGYITYLRFGLDAPYGVGTSLAADIYLNFGLAGVIFFMFLLGLFMKKLQNELNIQKSLYWIIVAGIFASVVFYMGRGGLYSGLRPIVWGLILTIILVKSKKAWT